MTWKLPQIQRRTTIVFVINFVLSICPLYNDSLILYIKYASKNVYRVLSKLLNYIFLYIIYIFYIIY